MNCLSDKTLREYAAGILDAEATASAYAHICSCDKCRAKFADLIESKRAIWSIGCNLLEIDNCPEYEELSDFVSEKLAKDAAERVRIHIAQCEYCHRDVESIQKIRSKASLSGELEVYPGKFSTHRERHWVSVGWRALAGTAAAAVVIAAVFLTQPTAKSPSGSIQTAAKPNTNIGITHAKPNAKIATSNNNTFSTQKRPIQTAANLQIDKGSPRIIGTEHKSASVAVALKDGDVVVKERGGVYSVNINEKALAELVERKLRNGSLPAAFTLAKNTASLRGVADSIDIPKLSPESYGIADSKPEFKWEPIDGAIRYRIEVFKLDGTPVIAAETENTSFIPDENLPAGGYKWIVGVRRAELADIRWSKADAFRVLSANEKSLISIAERRHPGSKLVRGCVYEHLGLNEEAAAQFEQLVKENPDSELAKKLLEGVTKKLR